MLLWPRYLRKEMPCGFGLRTKLTYHHVKMATNWPYRVDAYSVFQKILLESESTAKPSSLPVDNPTKPFWQYPGLTRDYPVDTENDPDGNKAANPLSHEGSGGSETLTNDADLVIIGSGITGVTVAYELSKKIREDESWKSKGTKFRVVIVEARDFCKFLRETLR
jgi:hypothetical protein